MLQRRTWCTACPECHSENKGSLLQQQKKKMSERNEEGRKEERNLGLRRQRQNDVTPLSPFPSSLGKTNVSFNCSVSQSGQTLFFFSVSARGQLCRLADNFCMRTVFSSDVGAISFVWLEMEWNALPLLLLFLSSVAALDGTYKASSSSSPSR